MTEGSADPRVIRTCQLLREALRKLVERRSFSTLSVKDITEEAGLNRSTFYLHYIGLHELLADYTRVLFNELREDIYGGGISGSKWGPEQVEPYVELVFHHLKKYQAFYKSMLGKRGDPYFNRLFQDLLSELLFEPIASSFDRRNPDLSSALILRFYCNGFTGVASWWLDNDMPIAIPEASHQITRDILPGYMQLMQA